MKTFLFIILVIITGCSSAPKLDLPVVAGKVYPYWYECELGALYRLDDTRVLMMDGNSRTIPCSSVKMTKERFYRLRADKMRIN